MGKRALGIALGIFWLIGLAGLVLLPRDAWWIAALWMVLSAPIVAIRRYQRKLALRAAQRALVVTVDGVSIHESGTASFIPWTEIVFVQERMFVGRYVFRDGRGATLFEIDVVVPHDGEMAKAVAAAARAGRLPEEGLREMVVLGAPWAMPGLAIALLLPLLAVALAIPWDSAPPLAELEQRTGRVAQIESRPDRKTGAILFKLVDDEFESYAVRRRDRALRVVAAVHPGDEVTIWHDRSERRFGGPVGAVFQLDVRGRRVLDRERETRADEDRRRSKRPRALAFALAGFTAAALLTLAQRRRALVRLRT